MKKGFLLIAIFLVLQMAGCASVQKKFTRKKPDKRQPSVIYIEEGPYQKKYSNEYYYKMHYGFWKDWHGELLNQLGGNRKKVARCAQEAYNHLSGMSQYLAAEKQAQLKPWVEALGKATKTLESGDTTRSEQDSLRSELEKIKRSVANDFYYAKVKDSLVPDNLDVGAPAPSSV